MLEDVRAIVEEVGLGIRTARVWGEGVVVCYLEARGRVAAPKYRSHSHSEVKVMLKLPRIG